MKPLRSKIKWLMVVIGLLLALLILKIAFFLTAKPKVTVDYVAEYNKITRPANYDPNDNAAPYYQKALDVFVKVPYERGGMERYLALTGIYWPADLDNSERAYLESWLASNSQALEYFKIAANKPYYWLEKQTNKDKTIFGILYPEFPSLRDLTGALLWKAKLNASKGMMPAAIEDILTCYKVGKHQCRSSLLLVSQHRGLGDKRGAVNSTLVMLNNINFDSNTLKSIQDTFRSELDSDTYVPSIRTQSLFVYDSLQRCFVDNGKGTGRLVFDPNFEYTSWRPSFIQNLYYCFFGPTKSQTIEQIEKLSTISDKMMPQTPWQIKNGKYKYFEEIEKINSSNLLLSIFDIDPISIFRLYHETNTQTEALITVLAILRFKADYGRFPTTLDELVPAGYLQIVPMDPYSNGPLVYKPTRNNFTLYSVGEDLVDDGGLEVVKVLKEPGGITEFYALASAHWADIVYWPVNKFKDSGRGLYPDELKKLKAAKEVEAQRKIEEVNQPQ